MLEAMSEGLGDNKSVFKCLNSFEYSFVYKKEYSRFEGSSITCGRLSWFDDGDRWDNP